MCAFGSTSQSTRNTTRMASCATRTTIRPRRSRASQSRYCGLAAAAAAESAFDMDFELLPEGVEIAVELRRVARGERGRAGTAGCREADRMVRFDLPGAARQHDDSFGHADRFADVVGD